MAALNSDTNSRPSNPPRSPSGNTELDKIFDEMNTKLVKEVRKIRTGEGAFQADEAVQEAHTKVQALIDQTATNRCIAELEEVMKISGNSFVGDGTSYIHWQTRQRIDELKAQLDKEE